MIDDRLNNAYPLQANIKTAALFALNEVNPDIIEATALVLLLQAASPTFNSEKYLVIYQKHQAMKNEMLFQMRFKIEAASKLSPIAEIVSKLLESEKLSASFSDKGRADAVISNHWEYTK